MNTINFWLGIIFGKRFRMWYWRNHKRKYLWGVKRIIYDFRTISDKPEEHA